MYQKTIKLFLYDCNPNERIICEISNWNGKAYKIPKGMLKKSKTELNEKVGVYFLLGENDGIPYIYIGESENLYIRLLQHLSDKTSEYWEELIAFTSLDNSFSKGQIKYLENELYNSAKKSARYEVNNKEQPSHITNLHQFEIAHMKEIIDNIKILTNSLGHKVFLEPINQKIDEDKTLEFKGGAFSAKGLETNEGFMVLKGSKINENAHNSLNKGHFELRKRLINEKIIDENYYFTENYEFNSSSNAGCIVSGNRVSGPQSWKDKNGKTLKQINQEL